MGIMVIMYALAVAVMAAVVSYTMIQEVKKIDNNTKEILTEKEIRRSQIIELMLKIEILENRMKKEAENDKPNE
ncbi:MAG: hypothetical protein HXO49_03545 [Prevotella sp.]|nr:hypothetical protein [Prevotella sp.]